MFIRTKKSGPRTYLQIVESNWVDGKVKQRVVSNLGRLDLMKESGEIDGLMLSLQRYSEKFAVLGSHERGETKVMRTASVGPALIFERLWKELGIQASLGKFLVGRKFGFSVERATFVTVLNRLFSPGSDRAATMWVDDHQVDGAQRLELQHFYRAMGWLGETLPEGEQKDATPFAKRCMKDLIEEDIFCRRRDLFTQMDIVFFDTTSIYFEGEGGEGIGQHGHSKDHRPDLRQMVVGMVLDGEGNPICSEMWPGNTADVKSLVPVVERLKKRFSIGNICIVADRGMISEETKMEIVRRNWKYILGVRMRRTKEARDEVLSRGGRYQEVTPKRKQSKDPSPLKVKEVRVGDRRHIVCLNEEQAAKDRHDREAIVASLKDVLKAGDKSLIGNKGYRKFVKSQGERFSIDEEKVEEDARYDGKWVLTTNTDLSAAEAALAYKQLWMVEDIFRSMKSLLETRPIFHKCDDTIRGHVFCSFMALLMRKGLEDRLAEKGCSIEWAEIVRDLNALVEMDISAGGKRYVLRAEAKKTTVKVFGACGVALPPTIRQIQQEKEAQAKDALPTGYSSTARPAMAEGPQAVGE